MARPRKITPLQNKEAGKFHCFYNDYTGQRKKGSLQTKIFNEAKIICMWLEELRETYSEDKTPHHKDYQHIDKRAFELFFDEEKIVDKISVNIEIYHDINDKNPGELAAMYAEINRLKTIVENQQDSEFELNQLKKDRLSRIINAGKRIPDTKQFFFDEYESYARSKIKSGIGHHLETVKKFLKYLKWPNLADIEKRDIRKWLFKISNDSTNPKFKSNINPNRRSNAYRCELTRFFNYIDEEYDILSQVPNRLKPGKNKITFNDPTEIKKLIEEMHLRQEIIYPDYWQTVVACLAWTGCLSKALWGLTHDDILYKNGIINAIRFRNNEYRTLKTDNRDRVIEIHPLLKPYLQNHLKSRYPGKTLIFPNIPKVIYDWNKYKSKERAWNSDTFSKRLKGETKDDRWIPGAIDKSYICNRSMRRTFAMLLMNQAGMTIEQVSAILGNNPATVKEWYAEIDESGLSFKHVDFSKKLQILSLESNMLKKA